jgi:uncharacterized repeat protein (TIGR03803 family)
MRRKPFCIAASCILALAGLLPVFSSGTSLASKEKVIYSFTGGADGAVPVSDLTIDSAGNLYGTTLYGGNLTACSSGCGTVFELEHTRTGWQEHVLYSFAGYPQDGALPEAGLIFDKAGNLYGTTAAGGAGCQGGCGTVFELKRTRDGWKEEVLYNFTGGNDGASPAADLVSDSAGNLYGTTSSCGNVAPYQCDLAGCGAVFELTLHGNGSWAERTLHTFTGAPDGGTPVQGVILDSASNAYGVTETGGTGPCGGTSSSFFQGCGTLYKLTPNSGGTWAESVIYSFHRGGGGGFYPSGGLLLDKGGHLLGTTWDGGDGLGTVFDLRNSQKGWWQLNPHIFYGNPDGIRPTGRLVADPEGNLFGVTTPGKRGGPSCGGISDHNCGIVFELEPEGKNHWTERILHTFAGTAGDGLDPQAGLVRSPEGRLYGTTHYGGSGVCNGGCGTVYEVTP